VCAVKISDLAGFARLIHEKDARNHPLSDAAKELNRFKSSIRACVEHVFGCTTVSMAGKRIRKIGLARTEDWVSEDRRLAAAQKSDFQFFPSTSALSVDRYVGLNLAERHPVKLFA
jgi:hypothetical protein